MDTISGKISSGRTGIAYRFAVSAFLIASVLSFAASTPASADPGDCTGTVFRDHNGDGTRQLQGDAHPNGVDFYDEEPGEAEIIVTAIDDDGAVVGTATTDAAGAFDIDTTAPTGTPIRVEFTWPNHPYLESGPEGADNESSVQFADAGSCTLSFGLMNPADYCHNGTDDIHLSIPCYAAGASDGATTGEYTLVSVGMNWGTDTANTGATESSWQPYFQVDETGAQTPPVQGPTHGKIGSTWGLAWNRTSSNLFASAVLKTSTGFGPNGPGAIYATPMDPTTGTPTGTPSLFADLGTLGLDVCDDPHTTDDLSNIPPTISDNLLTQVGACGIGDIDISDDDAFVYAVNLTSREVAVIDSASGALSDTWDLMDSSFDKGTCPDPATDFRPWALEYHDGKLYLGAVCSAFSSQDANDLWAYIYEIDPVTSTPTLAFDYQLGTEQGNWNPWASSMANLATDARLSPSWGSGWSYFGTTYPQPLLTDIEFYNDDLVLGFNDLYGHQTADSFTNADYDAQILADRPELLTDPDAPEQPYLWRTTAKGDTVCAAFTPDAAAPTTGTWTVELENTCGGRTSTSSSYGDEQGSAESSSTEFYIDGGGSLVGTTHEESMTGGLELIPGLPLVQALTNPHEALGQNSPYVRNTAGLLWNNNIDGSTNRSYTLYRGQFGDDLPLFGKANGLGDIESLCAPAPVEIGNYVWFDVDGDGVQDPSEAPVPGATVNLYAPDGTLLATAITDADGNYIFASSGPDGIPGNGDDLFAPGDDVIIRMDNPADYAAGGVLGNWNLTLDSQDSDDDADSDGIEGDAGGVGNGNFPEIEYAVGEAGENDHTLDFGFINGYDLALQKTIDTIATVFPVSPGDDVTFILEVANQGRPVQTIDLVDYIQTGFVYDPALNPPGSVTDSGDGDSFNYVWGGAAGDTTPAVDIETAAGDLVLDETISIPIVLTIDPDFTGGELVNWAEISNFDDNTDPDDGDAASDDLVDIDSTPNDDISDDSQPAGPGEPGDDEINGDGDSDGDDPIINDEDDHDVAGIPVLDAALIKTVSAAASELPATHGSQVAFTIEVINQGSVHATDIMVYDYVDLTKWEPFDTSINPGTADYGWVAVGTDGEATLTNPLAPGDSLELTAVLTVASTADLTQLWNTAEISDATASDETGAEITNPDGSTVEDIDSTPDTIDDDPQPSEPGAPTDNVTDSTDGDEDDHDIAGVEPPTFSVGNQVWFDENNDGIIDLDEDPIEGVWVELFTDNDGDGLPDDTNGDGIIDDSDAVATTGTDADGLYLFDGLEPGDYIVGIPPMEWDQDGPLYGMLPSDPVSTDPNDDVDNDNNGAAGNHNYVWSGPVTIGDGEPTGENPDNDTTTADANENLTVDFGFWQPVFDMALRKQLADGTNNATVEIGDTVTFTLEVFNQGTVDGYEPTIVDYVPVGLTLNDPSWTLQPDGTASTTLTGITIKPGESTTVDIDFTINDQATSEIINNAEISQVTPVNNEGNTIYMPNSQQLPDIDSVADSNNDDNLIDDEIDGTSSTGDEDDHDHATLNLTTTNNQQPTTNNQQDPHQILALTGTASFLTLTIGLMLCTTGTIVVTYKKRESKG